MSCIGNLAKMPMHWIETGLPYTPALQNTSESVAKRTWARNRVGYSSHAAHAGRDGEDDMKITALYLARVSFF